MFFMTLSAKNRKKKICTKYTGGLGTKLCKIFYFKFLLCHRMFFDLF